MTNHNQLKLRERREEFFAEINKYAEIIFSRGTELDVSEALDFLFELAEEVDSEALRAHLPKQKVVNLIKKQ